ncbi:MAG: glycosyltransferase family 4 protein [Desulfobacteraceae bacterium]|nr:glycosyltransferase family 4 protein [Desulfobacteraceae bacterium]
MRISYFNYHWEVDGGAVGSVAQIRSIAAALESLGHTVDLRFRNPRTAASQGKSEPSEGLKRFPLLRRYGHVPKLILRNRRFIAEEGRLLDDFRPDVVLCVSSYCNFSALYAARKRRIPYVAFVDGPLDYEYSLFFRQYCRYSPLARWLEGAVLRNADRVICVSEVLKGFLVPFGLDASKIHAVPNGIDPEAFKPCAPDPDILARYNLSGRVVIGYVGSFQYFSDLGAFIETARRLCVNIPDLRFLFVGAGRIGDELRAMSEAAGLGERMIFTGMVPHADVPRYIGAMDVLISPYRDDYLFYGSSMKLLEYMAGGKPVVITALGQIKEVVHDGCNGMLYEPGDYGTFFGKIETLALDGELRTAMGARARETVLKDWTWERQARRIASVVQEAIDARK